MTRINRKNQSSLNYPNLQSAHSPVAHCDEIQVPVFGELPDISDKDSSDVEENKEELIRDDDAPHLFSQMELNDLVGNSGLSKSSVSMQIEEK